MLSDKQLNLEKPVEKLRDLVRWYQSHSRWFDLGERALKTIYYARQGGPLTTAAACVTMGASVVEAAFPELSIDENLRRMGYHSVNTTIGEVLCTLIDKDATPTMEVERGNKTARIWASSLGGVAAVYSGGKYAWGPYVLGGDDRYLLDTIASCVWGQGSDLMLTTKEGKKGFALVNMLEPGPYIAKQMPEVYAERLSRYGARPRTLLIKGPTGIGKSVLARRVAALASCGTARTLKVSSTVLKGFGSAELRDLARYIQPSVLLLDDLEISSYSESTSINALLDTLESLRVEGCLVIITMMIDTDAHSARYRGENYVEGMRPGRIDEIVTLFAPQKKERELILNYYYDVFGVGDEIDAKLRKMILAQTDGLTGAYLREVAERLSVHGADGAMKELESILLSAPYMTVDKKKQKALFTPAVSRKQKTPAKLRQEAKRNACWANRDEKKMKAKQKKSEELLKKANKLEKELEDKKVLDREKKAKAVKAVKDKRKKGKK